MLHENLPFWPGATEAIVIAGAGGTVVPLDFAARLFPVLRLYFVADTVGSTPADRLLFVRRVGELPRPRVAYSPGMPGGMRCAGAVLGGLEAALQLPSRPTGALLGPSVESKSTGTETPLFFAVTRRVCALSTGELAVFFIPLYSRNCCGVYTK